MSIATSFYSYITAQSAITNITTEIYNGWVPQNGSFPALTFSVSDDIEEQTLDGIGSTRNAIFDVDCWATTLVAAEALAAAVKTALTDYYGAFGANTVSYIYKTRELHLIENDTDLRRVSLQFSILYGA